MRSWAKYFLKHNAWHILVGLRKPDDTREKAILRSFWSRYESICPDHDVFKMSRAGQICLERCAPICLHGDEGRGRKHRAWLVVSFRGLLGRGIEPSELDKRARKVKKQYLKQKCNYLGHVFTNRFLIASIGKPEYTGQNAGVFNELMNVCAAEAHAMSSAGVVDSKGLQRWFVMLHITGDWQWLHKSGNFFRSYNNCEKRKNQQSLVGICHQCQAGQRGVPFEQVATTRPIWLQTEYAESAFASPSPWNIIPHIPNKLEAVWVFDFFHVWHLGIAKYLIGSAVALLSMCEVEANLDDRFETLSNKYKSWCLRSRCRAHITKLTKDTINWASTKVFPCAAWHKGELSRVMMNWLESILGETRFPDGLAPMFRLLQEAVVAINISVKTMYKCDFWLTCEEGHVVSGHGLKFLRRYSALADLAQQWSMNLFSYSPKIHALHKIYLRVHQQVVLGQLSWNLLGVSVQQCEDFIGRPSRLSRRVAGGQSASQRVMDRYLQSCYAQWIEAGLLIRPV
eukprot:Skav228846  [mRNA]  locus=scaffold5096:11459:12994:- [translate_table: standard]